MRYTDKIESAIEAEFYKNGRTMFWFSQFRDFASPDELKVYFESMINTGRFVFIVDVYCEHCDEKVDGKEFRSALKAQQYLTQDLEHLECRSCERTMAKGNYYLHVSYRLSESWIERLKGPPKKKPPSSGDTDVPELKETPNKTYRSGQEAFHAHFHAGSNPIFYQAELIDTPTAGVGNTFIGGDNSGQVASGSNHKQTFAPKENSDEKSVAQAIHQQTNKQTGSSKKHLIVKVIAIIAPIVLGIGLFFAEKCTSDGPSAKTNKGNTVKTPATTKQKQ